MRGEEPTFFGRGGEVSGGRLIVLASAQKTHEFPVLEYLLDHHPILFSM